MVQKDKFDTIKPARCVGLVVMRRHRYKVIVLYSFNATRLKHLRSLRPSAYISHSVHVLIVSKYEGTGENFIVEKLTTIIYYYLKANLNHSRARDVGPYSVDICVACGHLIKVISQHIIYLCNKCLRPMLGIKRYLTRLEDRPNFSFHIVGSSEHEGQDKDQLQADLLPLLKL